MYTRNYCQDSEERIVVPENYDGNTFRTQPNTESATYYHIANQTQDPEFNISETPDTKEAMSKSAKSDNSFLSSLKHFIPEGLFTGRGFLRNGLSQIGTEEILIIGIALFLFFSKDCDKECALMLIFLLFVK